MISILTYNDIKEILTIKSAKHAYIHSLLDYYVTSLWTYSITIQWDTSWFIKNTWIENEIKPSMTGLDYITVTQGVT